MAIATASAGGRTNGSIWARLSNYSDLVLAAGVCAIVGMMIVPLPEWMLDLLIITNLSLGLVMLMVALYARDALEFSVFPSLLLITTLFRLGLDISATRLILLQAHAGQVVTAFGNFVVGGQLRRRRGRLPDSDRRQLRGHHQRCGPRRRSRGALHPRRDAWQADGDRRRDERGVDQRGNRADASPRHPTRS